MIMVMAFFLSIVSMFLMLWVLEDFCLFLVSCHVYIIFGPFSGIPVFSVFSEFTLFSLKFWDFSVLF